MVYKVFFRVDASGIIGLGHIVRCTALAQMLDSQFQPIFVCKNIPESYRPKLVKLGFKINLISDERDFLSLLSKGDFVVLDHYGLDSDSQLKIKNAGCTLICIDDLQVQDHYFHADLILNHSPVINSHHYRCESYTQFALGLEYALLRPVFLEENQRIVSKNITSAFICFGGVDPLNLTKRAIKCLMEEVRLKKIIAVVGSEYSNLDDLESSIAFDTRCKIYQNISPEMMVKVMSECDLAIVPASGVLQEVLAVGCVAISGMYVANQKNLYQGYKQIEAIIDAGSFSENELRIAIGHAINYYKAGFRKNIIDRKSGIRILKIFRQLAVEQTLHIRDAMLDDLQLTFRWASNSLIRVFSFNRDQISFQSHSEWYTRKIESESCYYYILELNGSAVGSIRFDISGNTAQVSYLIDPLYQNKSLGLSLLKFGFERFKKVDVGVEKVIGYVMSRNIASIRSFEKLGYSRQMINGDFKFIKMLQ